MTSTHVRPLHGEPVQRYGTPVQGGSGGCLYPAGEDEVECIASENLPVGRVRTWMQNRGRYSLNDGDFIVMVTDGVLEYLHVPKPEETMREMILSIKTNNPGILAKRLWTRVMLFYRRARTGRYDGTCGVHLEKRHRIECETIEEMRCRKKGMELEGLVKSGDVVLAGVSGGADSVCLLLMLLEYRKHCDFFPGRRCTWNTGSGEMPAGETPRLLKGFAKSGAFAAGFIRWMSRCMQRDTASALRRRRGSSAMSASGEAAEDYDGRPVKIALAHHADDNAETMLFPADPGERTPRTLRYAPGAQACGGRHGDPAAAWNGERRSRRIWRHRDSLTAGMRPMRIPTTAETGFAIR